MGVSGKREESQSYSSTGKKQRAFSSRGFQSRDHSGQGQGRVANQAGQMVCFHCQQPGHMWRDFPQRQGSQGLRTEQSQSIMGQERIQFFPPHPSMGRRGQHQSQGVALVPPVTQAGQRAQIMGRGRGRGP